MVQRETYGSWTEAFVCTPAGRITHAEVRQLGWAERLAAHGVSSGDRVMCVCANSAELVTIVAECLFRGIFLCVVNPQWPIDRIRRASHLFSPKLIFVDDDCDFAGDVTLSELKSTSPKTLPVLPETLPVLPEVDVPAHAIFTSGSSGEPRVAALSLWNLRMAYHYSCDALNFSTGCSWLLSLPVYHVGGLAVVFRCLIARGTLAIPTPGESLRDALTRLEPTHVSFVATQLYRLLHDDAASAALARCKAVVMGGGPTPESLVRAAIERGIPLVMSYGMTETTAMICSTSPGDPIERLSSSGKPLVDGTVSISADGEILVRGDQLFLGYLRPDGSLHRPLTDDGWFRTGDLGHFDDAGYLHVTGRKDNMFISGGENIQPEEIEQALRNLEGIEEALVVAAGDAEWGRRPVAFVRMIGGRALDAPALQMALRGTLPGYKIPRTYHAWPDDLTQLGLKPARREFEARARKLATDE